MMTQPLPIAGKLPIKTLVARQLPTNICVVCANTCTHTLDIHVIVISRARGMYGIYCTEARGREAARGLSAINAIHPECT